MLHHLVGDVEVGENVHGIVLVIESLVEPENLGGQGWIGNGDGGLGEVDELLRRHFQTRFPLSDKSAYVQYQVAMSLVERMKKPDRDQSVSRDALEELRAVRELYPTSEYAELAEEQIQRVRDQLAAHEMLVGRFYMRYGNFNGAISRFEYLLETYPEFEETDRVLFYLGMTHRKAEQEAESRRVFERLRQEYPDSSFVEEIPKPRGD